mmetsp:Transcript_92932/g.135811  ORF Transcript_92932/g.135811 Transcript_92932/m.135811 type:complete len:202 (+) Transcript_92932:10-615(+)
MANQHKGPLHISHRRFHLPSAWWDEDRNRVVGKHVVELSGDITGTAPLLCAGRITPTKACTVIRAGNSNPGNLLLHPRKSKRLAKAFHCLKDDDWASINDSVWVREAEAEEVVFGAIGVARHQLAHRLVFCLERHQIDRVLQRRVLENEVERRVQGKRDAHLDCRLHVLSLLRLCGFAFTLLLGVVARVHELFVKGRKQRV